MSSLRERIFSRPRNKQEFFVEGWGETVYIRELSISEREKFNNAIREKDENGKLVRDENNMFVTKPSSEIQIQALIFGVVDEAGNPVFTEKDRDQILSTLGCSAAESITIAFDRLNNPRIEDAVKNLKTTPLKSSGTN